MKRRNATQLLSVLLLGVSVTACAGWRPAEYYGPAETPADGPITVPTAAYERALYDGYLALARADQAKGEPNDADYFSQRALAVAVGLNVDPERIDGSRLPPDKSDELVTAWRLLVEMQEPAVRRAYNPDRGSLLSNAARAQVMFDCWMRREAEGRPADSIADCRSTFWDSLRDLQVAIAAGAGGPAKPATFLVYFDPESVELDALGQAVVAEAEAAARKLRDARVSIAGAGDRSSDADGARILAGLRASAVAKALAAGGLPDASIEITEPPEKLPAADDGGLNGRVEIVVATASKPREPAKPIDTPAKKPALEPEKSKSATASPPPL